MNQYDYSVESLDELYDLVDSFFDYSNATSTFTSSEPDNSLIDNDLWERMYD